MQTTEPGARRSVAVVTGGAVRVGRAISEALAAAGHDLWIHYNRSQGPAEALAAAIGGRCLGLVGADLADASARQAMIERLVDPGGPAGGRIDLLVNNAASFERGAFSARSDEDLLRVLTVNLVAPISLARGLAPALRAARGAIVNIVDLAGSQPWRGYLDHCTAKAGLQMATRALALELAPEVRVNGVAPGTVLWPDDPRYAEGTELRRRMVGAIPVGDIGRPEDVARAVLFLAGEPFINGHVLAVDGGRLAASGGSG